MSENKRPPAEPYLDAALVRELADVLNDTGLTEVEVERGELRIRITKAALMAAQPPLAYAPPAAPAAGEAPAAASAVAADAVKSPMVGTVYLQPQPGSPPFARVGDKVAEGQTLLLIEAMKTMNPIAAPKAGTLTQLLVSDGQPVEFGEPLLVIA
ncbi:MAG TPA: acetyl-CoA carboxylase biotin carboxyl carrier protein [Caulobacteraceae bacterium]|jgi:acetyl-CoA carboxylase biotin carboxyl carrier protein|nr:acetyl-CoA carboxylase biotin carboxyl carrier protein [Caulobacteraceae bacterium]